MCQTISWTGAVASWSLVVTLKLQGKQWKLPEATAP